LTPHRVHRKAVAAPPCRTPDAKDCLARHMPPPRYCPHRPTARQQEFLALDCLEALYGGAAGGGKSQALLMAALQYVDLPGYSALILRRDKQRLKLAGGLIPRSHEWLRGKGAIWNDVRSQWVFPTQGVPATLTFGYLKTSLDRYRYGSSEFQFIGIDELTEFLEEDYLFLFSRLRRRKGIGAPPRMRGASNPGGVGHVWVKGRFSIPRSVAVTASADERRADQRRFIPARIDDNPFLDAAEYRRSLAQLPPVVRQRLLSGDWSVEEASVFRRECLRYYRDSAGQLQIFDQYSRPLQTVELPEYWRFCTVDPAGAPADAARGGSWAVIQVWDQPRGTLAHLLLLRHQWRQQKVPFTEFMEAIREIRDQWRPHRILIEDERLGRAIVDHLRDLRPETIATQGRDKYLRAIPLINKFESGHILLPLDPVPWREALETELLAWRGGNDEQADQIDAAAYAAIVAQEHNGTREPVVLEPMRLS
jgi:phage terminase large subunit-like protein